jgi:hypothetical protein
VLQYQKVAEDQRKIAADAQGPFRGTTLFDRLDLKRVATPLTDETALAHYFSRPAPRAVE